MGREEGTGGDTVVTEKKRVKRSLVYHIHSSDDRSDVVVDPTPPAFGSSRANGASRDNRAALTRAPRRRF